MENFLLCYMGKWTGGVLSPTNMAAINIWRFKTLNSRYFSICWCIDLKLAEIFQNGVICIVKVLSKKNRLFKFLMTSLQTTNTLPFDIDLLFLSISLVFLFSSVRVALLIFRIFFSSYPCSSIFSITVVEYLFLTAQIWHE